LVGSFLSWLSSLDSQVAKGKVCEKTNGFRRTAVRRHSVRASWLHCQWRQGNYFARGVVRGSWVFLALSSGGYAYYTVILNKRADMLSGLFPLFDSFFFCASSCRYASAYWRLTPRRGAAPPHTHPAHRRLPLRRAEGSLDFVGCCQHYSAN
jgi:hypothetical protein